MRKRIMQVGAVAILALGVWLGQFAFRGPGFGGPGTGTGTGEGVDITGSAARNEVPSDVQTDVNMGGNVPAVSRPPANSGGNAARDMLVVVISGDGYRLVDSETDSKAGTPITLEEIRSHMTAAKGNPDGIRLRILKSRSAQEGARSDLLSALTAAGIKREEIQERAEFVD